ncbi:MAG: DUF1080 domain-containing protein [Bryobacterales bacterium]|nr:DUF1080 domain-containing protein [Bryobacterales bacterium]
MTKLLFSLGAAALLAAQAPEQKRAPGSSPDDPQPRVVTPGKAGQPPSDAIVLFDGKDLSQWTSRDGAALRWVVKDGAILSTSVTKESGKSQDLITKQRFGSAQLHLEFSIPNMPGHKGQAKGNSGVYLQSRYEIQVLDSYNNPTYPNGSAGALYGRSSPLVNPSLPPEQWQTYDIVFHAPKCTPDGKFAEPGSLTLFFNGVLVQDHTPVTGSRACNPEPGPLLLQDHYHPEAPNTPIRFRNIWLRPLEEKPAQ